MVADTVVAAENHAGYETQQFFRPRIQCTILIRLVVQTPKALQRFIALGQNFLIHSGPIFVKFLYY
jgi:hypothetical protein